MFSVTRVIYFCYGHRLLDYDGKCKHPHGHNGRVEITIAGKALDKRGMVMDFGDIKKTVQSWIDSELDHKMLLNERDELVGILRKLGEPVVTLKGNPTAENIAKHIYEYARAQKLSVVKVRLWETENSYAEYSG